MAADNLTFARDPESEAFIATFPPAYADGTGVLVATIEYNEAHPGNAPLSASHSYYSARITVDGTEIFNADDIGSPMKNGIAVDSELAYRGVLPAAISFASAYEGSGHGEVCNRNERAQEFSTVLDMANLSLDERDLVRELEERSI